MREERRRDVTLAGTNVAVTFSGQGTPMLVLGDLAGPRAPAPCLDLLSRHHELIRPAHPGFDGASRPAWLDSVSDLAMAYLELLERLDLRGVDLVGLGVGGWIAADLAARNCHRLRSLVIVGAHGLHLPGQSQPDIFLMSEEQLLQHWFADGAMAEAAIAQELTDESEDRRLHNQETFARLTWSPRLHDPHMMKWLHRVTVPSLVVWGAQDAILPVAFGHEWQRRLPAARLSIVAACGHAPPYEKPEPFVRDVEAFLGSLD
jgi:pimeloyl-ACP methyl ester carboxylesterase